MPSLSTLIGGLLAIWTISYLYSFNRNYLNARKTGFPSILVPWDQNSIPWMLISPPLRGWLKHHLPAVIFNRLALLIYGWEFHQRMKPFEQFLGEKKDLRTFMLVTFGRLEIYSSDAEVAAQILAKPRDFMQLDIGNWILGVFGNNIITSDGDHWARQRKTVSTVINERISKAVFNETVTQTRGLLEELSARQGLDGTTETNQLFNMAKKAAINVLSAAGMGTHVSWHDNTDDRPKPGFKQTYIQSVQKVIGSIGGPIIVPIWLLRCYPSFLPGHESLNNLAVAKTEFPVHTKDLLEKERIRLKTEGSATKSNVLSQLIQASDQPVEADEKALKGTSGMVLSEEELIGNLFIFTAAGFDTTANTISYALTLLARYPKWQDWLLEEIDAITPASPDNELDYVGIFPKATRLMAFMLETLRHFTPLVHIAKQTQKAQTISTSKGNFWLPANTTVYINNVALHGDPTLWRGLNAQPNEILTAEDEWAFRPTRWLNPSGSPQPLFQPPRGAYIPWSAGPRVCPGQKMAQVEFVAMFLTLLRRHRVEAVAAEGETRGMLEERLERTMRGSMSVLTMTMVDVFDVKEGDGKGLKLALKQRK